MRRQTDILALLDFLEVESSTQKDQSHFQSIKNTHDQIKDPTWIPEQNIYFIISTFKK